MKIIDYYDRINKIWIKLEVNDKVAEFLEKDDKKLKKMRDKVIKEEKSLEALQNKVDFYA